ncbi:antibiotic biosynthesis monooxygenase [Streptomyces inhibens]|uniref:antibiotic biosynthesis monooxygenase n=1 Tax=Streptomyces inhibens TaxID=2293571 RepID=UPI001EE69417|nr:antibiotic biosynthesis monooxygenase [Streptomyces inhibens]UKY52639.1 antibiotic biosynthesis monooxygenase [Streptomyces inhibens]
MPPPTEFTKLTELTDFPDFPDFRRDDAGTVLLSPWIVPDAAFQRPAADSVLAEWEHRQRPDAMLSLTAFLSTDGSHVLHYAQWTDDDAHREWGRTKRPAVVGRIDAAIPGIRRPGLVRYRRYRSYVPPRPVGRRPALLVTPAFATAGADAQRALADTVVDLLTREQVPGLLGAHFHLSQDGERVLNVAEWTDTSAWREFVDHGASARLLRAAVDALAGVTPAPAVLAQPATAADDPGGPEAPQLPAVPQYHLYKSLINISARTPTEGT